MVLQGGQVDRRRRPCRAGTIVLQRGQHGRGGLARPSSAEPPGPLIPVQAHAAVVREAFEQLAVVGLLAAAKATRKRSTSHRAFVCQIRAAESAVPLALSKLASTPERNRSRVAGRPSAAESSHSLYRPPPRRPTRVFAHRRRNSAEGWRSAHAHQRGPLASSVLGWRLPGLLHRWPHWAQ